MKFAAADAIDAVGAAVIGFEPEAAIGRASARASAVSLQVADPAGKLVSFDQEALVAAGDDVAQFFDRGVKHDVAHRRVGLFDAFLLGLLGPLVISALRLVVSSEIRLMNFQRDASRR